MVRYKDNQTYWHLAVVHIASYEKCKNISICMYTYPAIMHMHNTDDSPYVSRVDTIIGVYNMSRCTKMVTTYYLLIA
jgi:hypothetical protein